ncbi:hypothetical protein KA005_67400 [bacterium]|nr:hypothetical protein [bacterium]
MGCDIHGFLEVRNRDGIWKVKDKIPGDRNYDWFGVLAGVRNYVNTIPIAESRGVPIDASIKARKRIDSWDMDGHSHSWLTLKDFSEHDWESVSIDGRMSTIDRKTGKEVGKASYNARWGSEPDLYKYEHLPRVARDLMSDSWRKFLDKMEIIATKRGLENVRIVFWFDN